LFSVNWNQKGIIVADQAAVRSTPNTVNYTIRKYLTAREVEQLMDHARKRSRHGHRDATMILVAYRHGLRASELCGLEWHQVELDQGRLHVRRAKNGSPSVHPIRGDEIRALRRLLRENPREAHVFVTERGGPMTTIASTISSSASARQQGCRLPSIHTCCATLAASSLPTMATTPALCSTTSGTRISSIRCAIPSYHLTDSETSGDNVSLAAKS
jgi:integrase